MRYRGYQNSSPKSSCDLETEVKVTNTLSALMLFPVIHPDNFSGIPLTGSRNIVGTRICHVDTDANTNADTDADSNGIRTEFNMPPLTLVGT